MSVELYHQEFERLGTSAVEDLSANQGLDKNRRIYALRWLNAKFYTKLEAEARARRRAQAAEIESRRWLRIAGSALMILAGAAFVALVVGSTAVLH